MCCRIFARMKQLLLILFLLPVCCQAQLEVGVNGGIVPYKVSLVSIDATPRIGSCYGLSASYKVHRMRYGLAYNAATLPVTQAYTNGLMPVGSATLYYAKPLSSICLLAEREIDFDRFYLYFGVNAGAAFLSGGNDVTYSEGDLSGSGITVGVHAGCSYDFYKGLCANVQVGITDDRLQASREMGQFGVLMFPLTVGLHYKLHLHKTRTAAPAAQQL